MQLATLALILTAALVPAQDKKIVESRFHRVHLKNGNFVDGQLLTKNKSGVVLMLDVGEFSIRRGLIKRVEFVKMRSIEEPAPVIAAEDGAPIDEAIDKIKEKDKKEKGKKEEIANATPEGKPVARPVVMPFNLKQPLRGEVDDLIERLGATPRPMRHLVTNKLVSMGEAVAPYLVSLMEHVDAGTRPQLVDTIRQIKSPNVLPILKKLCTSESADIRKDTAQLLGGTGIPKAAPILRTLLKDSDSGVRIAAAANLASTNNPDAIEWLVDLSKDSDKNVQSRALKAAGRLAQATKQEAQLFELVEKKLWNSKTEYRRSMASALAQSATAKGLGTFVRLLRDRDEMVRAYAAQGLGKINVPEGNEVILSHLEQERQYWARIQLADSAKQVRLRAAVPILIEWLQDSNTQIRLAASRSLRHITGQNYGTNSGRWAAWWQEAKPN